MNYNFQNLILEGGGVKGIAYGGALEILDQMGYLKSIKRVAGTSAGAISATLLALNYSYIDLSRIISDTDFKSFEDGSFLPVAIARLLRKYGFYKGDNFIEWMGQLIKEKTGSPDTTFAQLQQMKNSLNFRDLYVVATNLSQQTAVVMSHESDEFKNLPVKEAVRMSMGIPLFFQSYKYKKDIMVDGGVTWNYPINLFDNIKYLSNPANGVLVDYIEDKDYVFNYETIGMRLDSKEVIDYSRDHWRLPPEQIDNIKDYTSALLNFLMESANRQHLHQNDWGRTIFIDTLKVRTTDFNLNSIEKKALVESGKKCTQEYFNWRNTQTPWNGIPVI